MKIDFEIPTKPAGQPRARVGVIGGHTLRAARRAATAPEGPLVWRRLPWAPSTCEAIGPGGVVFAVERIRTDGSSWEVTVRIVDKRLAGRRLDGRGPSTLGGGRARDVRAPRLPPRDPPRRRRPRRVSA